MTKSFALKEALLHLLCVVKSKNYNRIGIIMFLDEAILQQNAAGPALADDFDVQWPTGPA